jgi:hypothetical protein
MLVWTWNQGSADDRIAPEKLGEAEGQPTKKDGTLEGAERPVLRSKKPSRESMAEFSASEAAYPGLNGIKPPSSRPPTLGECHGGRIAFCPAPPPAAGNWERTRSHRSRIRRLAARMGKEALPIWADASARGRARCARHEESQKRGTLRPESSVPRAIENRAGNSWRSPCPEVRP